MNYIWKQIIIELILYSVFSWILYVKCRAKKLSYRRLIMYILVPPVCTIVTEEAGRLCGSGGVYTAYEMLCWVFMCLICTSLCVRISLFFGMDAELSMRSKCITCLIAVAGICLVICKHIYDQKAAAKLLTEMKQITENGGTDIGTWMSVYRGAEAAAWSEAVFLIHILFLVWVMGSILYSVKKQKH